MTTLAFIDSLPALERVREKFPDAQPVMDNPLLAADPRAGRAIINIDRLVTQPDAFALGRVALELAAGVDRRLEAARVAERFVMSAAGQVEMGGHGVARVAKVPLQSA